MTFPITVQLDNFVRADAPTLGANYTTIAGQLQIESNTAAVDTSTESLELWNQTFNRDQEVWCVLTNAILETGSGAWLAFRCNNAGSTGYICRVIQSGAGLIAHLYNLNGGGEIGTEIDLSIASFAVGDLIGIRAQGSTYSLYYRPFGLAAVLMGSWTDSTYLSSLSRIGLGALIVPGS